MRKQSIVDQAIETGIVPLFTHNDLDLCMGVLKAAYKAGIRVFEFTNRTEKSFENFKKLVEVKSKEMPDLALGIGTIYDVEMAQKYIDIGAEFIVAPVFNPAVGKLCKEQNIPWMPGVMTVTEVYNARQAGAEMIKIFPGDAVGSKFVKSLRGPMPDVKLMVTGGVSPTKESLGEWFSAGANCVGLGSQLAPKEAIDNKDFDKVRDIMQRAIAIIQQVRN
jgi:2-dehydro-3-deoxyphosphogluconate aldolase/(4S)-4-hydroxy-2-oxoglutarate aldolase